MDIESIIYYLISLRQEGSYWDFKSEWYKDNNDLLLDIICFANNLVNKDCYIIIGIDEENNYAIKDVSKDVNRKNTQNITDFLKDKSFAGGIRPVVTVEQIYFNNDCIDIIIVHNSTNTPFYLTKRYKNINPYHIYTRVQDTNTAINSSADINHVEYLWRKRFRLDETPLEKMTAYLLCPDDWSSSPIDSEDTLFYKYSPEYRIVSESDDRDGYEIYHFTQVDSRPHWETTYLYYHQTVLDSFSRIVMDGARWTTIAPDSTALFHGDIIPDLEYTVYYSYTKNTLRYILHKFFLGRNSEQYGYNKFLSVVLIFENNEEKINFEKYVLNHIPEFLRIYNSQKEPYMENIEKYNMNIFKNEYKASVALKKMLEYYRIIL